MPKPWSKWTDAEIDIIRANYAAKGAIWVATVLERPLSGVYTQATKLGLRKTRNDGYVPPWTDDEDEQIRAGYAEIGASALAKKLGRSVGAVYNRAHILGIAGMRGRRYRNE